MRATQKTVASHPFVFIQISHEIANATSKSFRPHCDCHPTVVFCDISDKINYCYKVLNLQTAGHDEFFYFYLKSRLQCTLVLEVIFSHLKYFSGPKFGKRTKNLLISDPLKSTSFFSHFAKPNVPQSMSFQDHDLLELQWTQIESTKVHETQKFHNHINEFL